MAKEISKKRLWIFRLMAVGLTLLVCLFLVDLIVKSGDSVETAETISLNDAINARNEAYAASNPHGFTDVPHTVEKPEGVFRIAFLGDSFIWGDGLPYEDIWTHKLADLIQQDYRNIEALHWGRNGWQTTHHKSFYDTAGKNYDIDLLVIGYVDNDPDMDRFDHMDPAFREHFAFLYNWAPGLAALTIDRMYAKSYAKWLDKLYQKENLTLYADLLQQFKHSLDADSLDYFMALTPACLESCHVYYDSIKPVLDTVGFDYIDTYYESKGRLGHIPFDSLRANPSNYHPGHLMTEVFADITYKYMLQHNYLPDSLRR